MVTKKVYTTKPRAQDGSRDRLNISISPDVVSACVRLSNLEYDKYGGSSHQVVRAAVAKYLEDEGFKLNDPTIQAAGTRHKAMMEIESITHRFKEVKEEVDSICEGLRQFTGRGLADYLAYATKYLGFIIEYPDDHVKLTNAIKFARNGQS